MTSEGSIPSEPLVAYLAIPIAIVVAKIVVSLLLQPDGV